MAPVTRSQAARASVLAPHNDDHRIQRNLRQRPATKRLVPAQRPTKQLSYKQIAIIDRALRESTLNLYNVYRTRIRRGLSKDELLEGIKSALRERRRGEMDLDKKLEKTRTALKAAATEANPTTVPDDFVERLVNRLYNSLKGTHELSTIGVSTSLQTPIESYLGEATESPASIQEPSQPANAPEVEGDEMLNARSVRDSPQLVLDERGKIAKVVFSPKCGKDGNIEFALLEILSILGRDSLNELSYEDYVRIIQVVKQEQLATIKFEIHWGSVQAE